MPIRNGREAAMQALLQMEENEGYSNLILVKLCGRGGLIIGSGTCFHPVLWGAGKTAGA